MKRIFGMMIVLTLMVVVTPLGAQERLAKRLGQACKTDIKTYCKDIKPGGGRILTCLQANSDRLSEQCAEVTQEADVKVKQIEDAMAKIKAQCSADFEKYCKDVTPGKGRILKCVKENEGNISQECKDALKEAELQN